MNKYSGILKIGFKLLVNDRGKFSALLIGLTFSVFLMMEMTAMFAGILSRACSNVTNIGAAMWIMDTSVNTVTSPLPMPDYLLDAVRSMDGVSYAVPLYMGGALIRLESGKQQPVTVVGLDDASLFGRPAMLQGNILVRPTDVMDNPRFWLSRMRNSQSWKTRLSGPLSSSMIFGAKSWASLL